MWRGGTRHVRDGRSSFGMTSLWTKYRHITNIHMYDHQLRYIFKRYLINTKKYLHLFKHQIRH
ncbi:hypothetical protein Hanom_Chr14g01284021 [Helianthus anomalus]